MRLATVCVIFQLRSVAPTTAGSTHTHGPALDLVTVSSRDTTNASSAQSLPKSHDSTDEVIDLELWKDEERADWRSTVLAAIDGIRKINAAPPHLPPYLHPLKVLERIEVKATHEEDVVYDKLKHWIMLVDEHNIRFNRLVDTAVIGHLLESVREDRQRLVNFLAWLHGPAGMERRAIDLQRALFDKFGLKVMFPLWKKARISPKNAYHMMPIGTLEKLSGDVGAAKSWPEVRDSIREYIAYFDMFYGPNQFRSVAKALFEFRDPEELLLVSTSLAPERADKLQKLLYADFPEIRPKVTKVWMESSKSPAEVYKLMPIYDDVVPGETGTRSKEALDTFYGRFKEWFDYIDEYMDRSIIFSRDDGMNKRREEMANAIAANPGDDAIAAKKKEEVLYELRTDEIVHKLLDEFGYSGLKVDVALYQLLTDMTTAKSLKDKAIAKLVMSTQQEIRDRAGFINWLRNSDKYTSRVDTMQQWMLTRSQGNSEKIIFESWVASGLSPEDVYHMMPFALEKRVDPTNGVGEEAWFHFRMHFMQWLRYIEIYNYGEIKFGVDQIDRVLTIHRDKHEVEYLSKYYPKQS